MNLLGIVILSILFLFILLLFFPIKIKVDFHMQTRNKRQNIQEVFDIENQMKIYVFEWIKVKTIQNHEKDEMIPKGKNADVNMTKLVIDSILKSVDKFVDYEKKERLLIGKKDLIKFKNSLCFKEFYLQLGFNLNDPIWSAYMIALLNAFINMYIAKHVHQFDLKNTAYQTYLSSKIIDFQFSGIIKLKLVNTIGMVIKLIIHSRKVVEKNG